MEQRPSRADPARVILALVPKSAQPVKTEPFEARSIELAPASFVAGWPEDKWTGYRHAQYPEQIEKGIAQARGWLAEWVLFNRPDCPGFLLYGEVGRGKTGGALELALQAGRRGCSVLYVTAETMLRDLNSTEYQRREGETKAEIGRRFLAPEVLIVDDICARSYTGPERAFLLDLVRTRPAEGKITIQTTNLLLNTDEGEDLYTRFLDGRVLSSYKGWRIDATKWGPSLRGRADPQREEI